MTPHAKRLAELSLALAAREEQCFLLWTELKRDILHQPDVMRRYCACLRLCGWMQRKIRRLV